MAHVGPKRHSKKNIIAPILRKTHIGNVHSLIFHVLSPVLRTYQEH